MTTHRTAVTAGSYAAVAEYDVASLFMISRECACARRPGLPRACRSGWLACLALQAVPSAHVACAPRLRLRQAFLRMLWLQNSFKMLPLNSDAMSLLCAVGLIEPQMEMQTEYAGTFRGEGSFRNMIVKQPSTGHQAQYHGTLHSEGSFRNLVVEPPAAVQTQIPASPVRRLKSWGVGGVILSKASVNVALHSVERTSSHSARGKIAALLSHERLHNTVVIVVVLFLFGLALVSACIFITCVLLLVLQKLLVFG